MPFNDHFSSMAAEYAQFRPRYPSTLFTYLASLTPGHDCAWDCATGNGQAAIGLVAHYRQVIATDASAAQLAHALPHPAIRYAQQPAEQTDIPTQSIDLITIANALHWFTDFDRFYAEARRVLRPDGVLAAWFYHDRTVDSPDVMTVLNRYAEGIRDYWPSERRHVDDGYRSLPFPLGEIPAPTFGVEAALDLPHFLGGLETTSAAKEYRRRTGVSATDSVRDAFHTAWGDPTDRKMIHSTITLRVGRFA